ncbi:hypothetical protein OPV22_023046 [Ensete ventricosum]|uniref:Uncharacterized protein n=1 Tax=Ensete ventricosum TaxID=4639 RepID=A0AAV8QVS3_ENSVE|nr:hypothetical protein OPV22_023046 [Ensete ventricosum]
MTKQKVSRIGKYYLHERYTCFGLSTEATWTYVSSVVPVLVPPNQAASDRIIYPKIDRNLKGGEDEGKALMERWKGGREDNAYYRPFHKDTYSIKKHDHLHVFYNNINLAIDRNI